MEGTKEYTEKIFEDIKHTDESGKEYWEARELQKALEYKEWRNFKLVIDKAIISCNNSNFNVFDHFVDFNKMVEVGSGAKRKQDDYKLSRYACYLIDTIYKDEILWLSQKECCNELDKKSVTEKCSLTADD